ncbi:MAG: hypothetical protein OEY57_16180 [Nitrospirota bacterium]|nr:hypothetical protein [Nitrospirota bacterium]
MLKLIRWSIVFSLIFGAGFYTGQQPDVVKQALRNLSGEVLDKTIGLDQTVKLQRQMLGAKEGLVEGRAYLLDHNFSGASEEFERTLQHLDEAVALDPQGPLAQKIEGVKRKVREAQTSLAQGRNLPPHLLEDLRQELQAVLPQ